MAAFYKYIKGYMSDGTTTQYIFFNQSGEKDNRPYFSNSSDATAKHYLVSEDGDHTFTGRNDFNGETDFNNVDFWGKVSFLSSSIPEFTKGIDVSGFQFVRSEILGLGLSIKAGNTHFLTFTADQIAYFHGPIISERSVSAPYFNASSDRRLKTNINTIEDPVLPLVTSTPVYTFNYKKDPTTPVIGIMAQDVLDKNVNDFNLVKKSGDNYYEIKESKMIYILWKAVQEQQKQIEALQARLEGEVNGEADN